MRKKGRLNSLWIVFVVLYNNMQVNIQYVLGMLQRYYGNLERQCGPLLLFAERLQNISIQNDLIELFYISLTSFEFLTFITRS